jgi:hypothetical protein
VASAENSSPTPKRTPRTKAGEEFDALLAIAVLLPEPEFARTILRQVREDGGDPRRLYDVVAQRHPPHWPPILTWEDVTPDGETPSLDSHAFVDAYVRASDIFAELSAQEPIEEIDARIEADDDDRWEHVRRLMNTCRRCGHVRSDGEMAAPLLNEDGSPTGGWLCGMSICCYCRGAE